MSPYRHRQCPLTNTGAISQVIVISITDITLEHRGRELPDIALEAVPTAVPLSVPRAVEASSSHWVAPRRVEVTEARDAVGELSAIGRVDGEGICTRLAVRTGASVWACAVLHIVHWDERRDSKMGGVSCGIVQGGVV